MFIKVIIKHIEERLNLKFFKEDLRKLGVNLVTGGIIGLFITHIVGVTFLVLTASLWVIIIGVITTYLGLRKRKKYG